MSENSSIRLCTVSVRLALALPAEEREQLPTRDELGTARTLIARAANARGTPCWFGDEAGWMILRAQVERDVADYLFAQLSNRLARLLQARTAEIVVAQRITDDPPW